MRRDVKIIRNTSGRNARGLPLLRSCRGAISQPGNATERKRTHTQVCVRIDRANGLATRDVVTRHRLSSPYISIIAHLNVPKQKIRKIQYYRIGARASCLSEVWKEHISAPTRISFYYPPPRVKIVCRESLQSEMYCIEFQLLSVPRARARASFYPPRMQNFSFHHLKFVYHALYTRFNCIL